MKLMKTYNNKLLVTQRCPVRTRVFLNKFSPRVTSVADHDVLRRSLTMKCYVVH